MHVGLKLVTLWGSKCVFVLFIHQEIIIHKADFLLCQHKRRNLSWPVQLVVNHLPFFQAELNPKSHQWQLISLFLLTFLFCSSSLFGRLIPWVIETFWRLLNYFLQYAIVMNIHISSSPPDPGKKRRAIIPKKVVSDSFLSGTEGWLSWNDTELSTSLFLFSVL